MPSPPRRTDRGGRLAGAAGLLAACLVAGCATVTGSDPGARTLGTIFDDRGTESAAKQELQRGGEALAAANLGVASFNGVVLLTGQVANQALKRQAQQAVERVRTVRRVHNEIVVGPPDTLVSRTNDRLLTTKVQAAFVASEAVNADRVSVVTRNGTVFLMGIVPAAQSAAAAQVASEVLGVQRVVKVFEQVEPLAGQEEDEAK